MSAVDYTVDAGCIDLLECIGYIDSFEFIDFIDYRESDRCIVSD